MTKRSKIVMGGAVALALCVIATAALALAGGADAAGWAIGIAVAGIASVPVVYYTLARRGRHEKLLDAPYFQKYEVVKDRIANSQLSVVAKRDMLGDVMDMLLSAQKSGRSAEEAVGDAEGFARDALGAYARPGRLAALGIFDALIAFSLFVLGCSLFIWLEETPKGFFNARIDFPMIVLFAIVAFAVIPAMRRATAGRMAWLFLLPLAVGIAFVLVMELLRAAVYQYAPVKAFIDGSAAMIPNAFALVAWAAAVPLALLLKNLIRSAMLRRAGNSS